MPPRAVLFKMERNGVLIDAALCAVQSAELGRACWSSNTRPMRLAGQPFNLDSPKQIGEILFEQAAAAGASKRRRAARRRTDEEVLREAGRRTTRCPRLLLDHRGLSKLKSHLYRQAAAHGQPRHRARAYQLCAGGGDYRAAGSNDPNLQNIPMRTAEGRRIREAFIAPAGSVIVSADYSQIELRIMAHVSRRRHLLRAFAEGNDIHRATAAEIFACRRMKSAASSGATRKSSTSA